MHACRSAPTISRNVLLDVVDFQYFKKPAAIENSDTVCRIARRNTSPKEVWTIIWIATKNEALLRDNTSRQLHIRLPHTCRLSSQSALCIINMSLIIN